MVAEQKAEPSTLVRLQFDIDLVDPNWSPSVCDAVRRLSRSHDECVIPTAIRTEEGLSLRVKTSGHFGSGEEREVISSFSVLGFVIDDTGIDLDFAGVEVPLEVGHVVLGIPERELDACEE